MTTDPAAQAEIVVLPDDEGEIASIAGWWEEFFLMLASWADDDEPLDPPLPALVAGRAVADAFGELVIQIRRQAEVVVQPIAPEGTFEHIPLQFVPLPARDRDLIVAGLGQAINAPTPAGHVVIREALDDAAYHLSAPGPDRPDRIEDLLRTARRLAALLQTPIDDDVELLQPVLGPTAPTRRVVLSIDQEAALDRLTTRILDVWHDNDPLMRLKYRNL